MFERFCNVQFHIVYLVLIITYLLHKYATLIVYPTDSGDGEKDIILPESTKHTSSNIDKDAEMDIDGSGDMKRPSIRSYGGQQDDQGERSIHAPTSTRSSRRTKKLSEISSGDFGLATSESIINEEQENASTQNTPSSSASSSR